MQEIWICPGEPVERPRIMTGKCSNPRHKPFAVIRLEEYEKLQLENAGLRGKLRARGKALGLPSEF